MRTFFLIPALLVLGAAAGCSNERASLEVSPGSNVTIQKKDGVTVVGRLVEVKPDHVIVERREGGRSEVRRSEIANLRTDAVASTAPGSPAPAERPVGSSGAGAPADRPADTPAASGDPAPDAKAPRAVEYRDVTIPAGTILPVQLTTAVGSDSSRVEDAVRGTLRTPVTIDGVQALPAGTAVLGTVTAAERSARVKGRARVAFRFTTLDPPGAGERLPIRSDAVSRVAAATKKQDAAKIGGGAAGGAIIGGIIGGGDGAAKGAAIGGAAGTGVVLSTRGREVRLGPGTNVRVRLAAPVTVRVAVRG